MEEAEHVEKYGFLCCNATQTYCIVGGAQLPLCTSPHLSACPTWALNRMTRFQCTFVLPKSNFSLFFLQFREGRIYIHIYNVSLFGSSSTFHTSIAPYCASNAHLI